MTDTTHAPERIWVDFYPRDWPTERIIYGEMPEPYVKYIREDISDARVAAAYEAAADVLLDRGTNVEDPIAVRKDILALTAADAKAALDRLIAEAVKAEREACAEIVDEFAAAIRRGAEACRKTHPSFADDRDEYADDAEHVAAAIRKRGRGDA